MDQIIIKNSKAFYNKKVSVNQAIKILKRNGIQIDENQAKEILDFLYLIASTYNLSKEKLAGP